MLDSLICTVLQLQVHLLREFQVNCPKEALNYLNMLVAKDLHEQGSTFLQSLIESFANSMPLGPIARERSARKRRKERYMPMRSVLRAEAARLQKAKQEKQNKDGDDIEGKESYQPDYGDDDIEREKKEAEERSFVDPFAGLFSCEPRIFRAERLRIELPKRRVLHRLTCAIFRRRRALQVAIAFNRVASKRKHFRVWYVAYKQALWRKVNEFTRKRDLRTLSDCLLRWRKFVVQKEM